ncbi:MAG: hypothetical protein HY738_17645 [Bacteroidia bacterium]|nr:hypothetical protein [Bacteroidia bacterium]
MKAKIDIKQKIILALSFVAFLLIIPSCSVLLSKMYGVNQLDSFSEKDYKNFVSKIKIDGYNKIISNEVDFKKIINLGHTEKQKNDFGQPIQILYFEDNYLKSFHANCYAKGGITSIDWNTDMRFSSFLPNSAVNIDTLGIELMDYSNIYPEIHIKPNKRYTILIFWTLMLEKLSVSAINTVIENVNNFEKWEEIDIYIINTDKYFSQIK